MGPYAGVDYNLTLCALQSRLQHIYQATHARVDFIHQSRTLDLASIIFLISKHDLQWFRDGIRTNSTYCL
jgi:hypothetical protein